MNKTLKAGGLPPIMDTYNKGDKFEGLMFGKCANLKTVEAAVSLFRRKAPTFKDDVVWCNVDRPFQERTSLRVLFKFKKTLTPLEHSQYSKSIIRIDEDTRTMKVAGKPILQVSADDAELTLK